MIYINGRLLAAQMDMPEDRKINFIFSNTWGPGWTLGQAGEPSSPGSAGQGGARDDHWKMHDLARKSLA